MGGSREPPSAVGQSGAPEWPQRGVAAVTAGWKLVQLLMRIQSGVASGVRGKAWSSWAMSWAV